MKDVVLITGANGMLAKNVSKILQKDFEIRFLTRKKRCENEFEWDIENQKIDIKAFENVKHIIHLAGAGIADKPWSKDRKKMILSSRVDSAKLILDTLKKLKINLKTFISASAIGFYGTKTTNNIYTETDKKGYDFLSDVCFQWERVAHQFKEISERVSILRIGVILSENGGALAKMAQPIKYYFGAVLGSGKQYMPWIHIDDLSNMIKYVLQNKEIQGIFNAVSPEYITNKDFTLLLAKTLEKPVFFPNIPSFLIRFVFGESAILLLQGSRISSEKIIKSGFKFKYEHLEDALNVICK